jgi:flagellar protein FliL
MSAAAAVDATEAPKKTGGKKKLLVVLAVAVLTLALAGGGALWWMKKRAAALAAEEGDAEATEQASKSGHRDDKHAAPTFVPLDMFTVNLADRESERYAQIGITLELDDPQVADQLKVYMPAIRNNILMALASKTSADLLEREGKVRFANEVRREAGRGLGLDIPADEAAPAASAPAAAASGAKRIAKKPEVHNPISRVHFSNFIIQ